MPISHQGTLLFIGTLVLMGCNPSQTTPTKWLAKVNGVPITQSQLLTKVQTQYKVSKEQSEVILSDNQVFHNYLKEAIDTEILYQQALHEGVHHTHTYQNAPSSLSENKSLLISLLLDHDVYFNINVTEEEARKYYQENIKDKPTQERLFLHRLYPTKTAAKAAILSYQQAPNSTLRPIGWKQKEQLIPELAKVGFSLTTPGLYPTPISSQYGYHVLVFSQERHRSPAQYETIKSSIKDTLIQNKKASKKQAYIQQLLPFYQLHFNDKASL